MDYVLTTSELCKYYRHSKALCGVTMNVPKGAIYGFVGKNGSGKTTLIRVICGLQEETSGCYKIYGVSEKGKKLAEQRRRIGAVVETPSLYSDMTARDNLAQQCMILGVPSHECISELLKIVGLENTGKKRVKNFSLGMKQRLGIAMAMVGDPDLLILDEPVNGLDPQGIIEIRELIVKLNREKRMTIIVASHILDELAKVATHYGFIDRGRIIKEISADELFANCKRCTRAEVTNIEALVRVLDSQTEKIEYKIISDTTADIYSKLSFTTLAIQLERENCEIISCSERDEGLESFYVKLVGGVVND